MNLSTEKKIKDLENGLVVARGEGEGVGCIGSLLLKLPLEWISNEILLCSTGNYVQSLMMEHDSVRKKMYTCMCNWVTILYSRKKIMYCGNLKRKLLTIITMLYIIFPGLNLFSLNFAYGTFIYCYFALQLFISTVQHSDPVIHTSVHSFFSHYHAPS